MIAIKSRDKVWMKNFDVIPLAAAANRTRSCKAGRLHFVGQRMADTGFPQISYFYIKVSIYILFLWSCEG